MNKMPILYFKPSIVVIDDDELLLKTLKEVLSKHYNIITFSDPLSAKEYLESRVSLLDNHHLLNGFNQHEVSDQITHSLVDFNTNNLNHIMNNPDKQNEVALIIADYLMPGINGLELCAALKNKPFKKILLTGHGDYSNAIQALNHKTVDYFLEKSNSDLYRTLLDTISVFINRYFMDMTVHINKHLQADNKLAITDEAIIKYLQEIINQHNIVEYHIIDKYGSYLLTDNQNKQFVFLVHNESSIQDFLEIIDEEDNANIFINKILDRELIPFFGVNYKQNHVNVSEYNKFLYPATKISGNENYYTSLINI